ncbi:MAG: Hsp20/alpha crystallin family protein [Dehalococcoidia bacterium]|nr:Hsp20/alpha crystallin family protein [Dehalococcoidia bacterium]
MIETVDTDVLPQMIPVKVYRSAERLTIAAPMPGVEPEDIAVGITDDGRIVLHGELRGVLKGDKEVLADEWTPGPYHREYVLPSAVDGAMANVTYGNGVLVVALPLADHTRPAHLLPQHTALARGELLGNSGHPVRPFGERLDLSEKPADAQAMTERLEVDER